MSVLALTGAYAPELSSGGLQVQAIERRLRGRVVMRVLTTAVDPQLPAHDSIDAVPVSRVPWRADGGARRLRGTAMMLRELIRLARRSQLIHVQGYSTKNILATAVAKALSRPLVMHLQTSKHDEPPTIKAQGALAWWAFSSADMYVAVSPGLRAAYLAAGLPAAAIREIPNGVDAERFAPADPPTRDRLRAQLGIAADRPVVLFVGVMSPDKRPDLLYEAWSRLAHDSTLVFVGASDPGLYELGDRLADKLRAAVQSAGLGSRVMFVPPTRRVEDYFRAADLFVMPSAREGLPIVLLEAMACGLPCVASRLPGSTDGIVEDGVNGRLVPSGDVAAMAAAIAAMLASPADAARMGHAARRTVEERYTIEAVAEQWLAAYRDVLAAS
jgi:glycosyltransferase involved in cell wall biosynthesis